MFLDEGAFSERQDLNSIQTQFTLHKLENPKTAIKPPPTDQMCPSEALNNGIVRFGRVTV